MKWSKIRKYIFAFGFIIILLLLFTWPMSSYIEGPGDASNLKPIVNIHKHPDRYKGKFMLTSVSESPAHPISYLYAKFNPHYSIENQSDVTGNQDMTTYNNVQNFYMKSAINEAIYTAYKSAHQEVTKHYNGIYVLDIMKGSHFKNYLHVGDTILRVNNHHFNSALGFQNYIKRKSQDKQLTIQYEHDGKIKNKTAPLVKVNGSKNQGIGIILTDNVSVNTKIPVNVDPGQVGGPSGGLMFTLQMYGQLKNQNIRKNKNIAGTGTINPDGSVGEIGGIDKKIIAAKRNGAKIFLSPYIKPTKDILQLEPDHMTNYQLAVKTANKYAPEMKVIPVSNFNDALNKLNNY